ncbi:hypothetical protein [Clostridium cellulovorans]|uniref:Uncharacterized protein n=2 Tax=Clostridium cellulovorans TaxID=1493 RepID=D9SS76_CLOC7|nr:hypothetical protein [Clostridium cellulovorans]ADL52523.1 hypothetical protein Clocel_2827 [Clostridium cellulovorans 743B]
MRLNGSEITVSLLESQGSGAKIRFPKEQNQQSYEEWYKGQIQLEWHKKNVGLNSPIETEIKNNISTDSYQKVFMTRDETTINNNWRKSVLIVIDLQNDTFGGEFVSSQQPKVKLNDEPMNSENEPEKTMILNWYTENENDESPKCFYEINNMTNKYVAL